MNFFDLLLKVLIYLYVLLLPIIPHDFKYKGIPLNGDIILLLIIFTYFIQIMISKLRREELKAQVKDLFNDKLGIFISIFFSIMMISTLYAEYKVISISESLRFLTFIFLFFIIKYESGGQRFLKNFIKLLSISCLTLSIFGLYQYFTKYNLDKKFINKENLLEITRVTATLENPNSYGAFLILVFFPILMFCIYEKSKIKKCIYAIISVLAFTNIILTGSRNAQIGIVIGCVVLTIVYNWKMITFIVPLGCCAFIIPQIRYRIMQKLSISQNMDRLSLWNTAFKMIKENPILGVGNGNYVQLRNSFVRRYPKLYFYGLEGYPTHNSYLKIQSELGLFGIAAFLILLIIILYRMKLVIRESNNDFYKTIFQGIFASTIAFLAMNIFDNLLFVPQVAGYFWIFVSLEEAYVNNSTNILHDKSKVYYNKYVNKRVLSGVIALVLVLGAFKGIIPFINEANKTILISNIKNLNKETWPLVKNKYEYDYYLDKALQNYEKYNVSYSSYNENYESFGDYLSYGKMFKYTFEHVKFGEIGLPITESKEGDYYNPIIAFKYALAMYGKYVNGEDTKDEFLDAVDSIISIQSKDGSFRYNYSWKYYINKDAYEPGWVSCIAQGQALSVFARAYQITKDQKYLEAGNNALNFLITPVDEGGVKTTMKYLNPSLSKYVFFDQYISDEKSTYALNGFMYALIGLYDWSNISGEFESKNLAKMYFDNGIDTLEHILPYYNLKGISTSDLSHIVYEDTDPHINIAYNSLNAYLLRVLYSITKIEDFNYYGELWKEYIKK